MRGKGLEVVAHHAALLVGRTVVVVIVEAGLADRDDRRRHPGAQTVERSGDVVGRALGFVRMDADRRLQAVALGGGERALAVGEIAADRHDAVDAGGAGAREHRLAILVEPCVVNVRVGVGHRDGHSARNGRFRAPRRRIVAGP